MNNQESIEQSLLNYKNLVKKIDDKCNQVNEAFAQHIKCKKGCFDCCIIEAVFPVEAVAMALSIVDNKTEINTERKDDKCNFLKEGICTIYDARPIICRTHGLPIMFEDNGVQKADCCPLNFTETDENLNSSAFIDIDKINSILYTINTLFIKELNLPFSPEDRIPLTDIGKFI